MKHSGRLYKACREGSTWELRQVWELLGSHRVPRHVDRQGKVSIYNRPYSVGLRWAGRTIWVGFDSEEGAWTFQDEQGHEIRRQPATELSAAAIRAPERDASTSWHPRGKTSRPLQGGKTSCVHQSGTTY